MELMKTTLALVVALTLAGAAAAAQKPSPAESQATADMVKAWVESQALPGLRRDGETIASFGSRQTGQPGCTRTAQFVRDAFTGIGLENVTLSTAPVTVPVSGKGSIALPDGTSVEAWPLVPNSVQPSSTPDGGLKGRLVYAAQGTMADVKGKDLRGAIVLLDYNSGASWIQLMKLGAKAAVFIEPDFTTWREADGKYSVMVPLDFPRVWVWKAARASLMAAARRGDEVTLVSQMSLDDVDAPWVEGYLPGSDGGAATINLVASFDTRSVVPALSPGGDELWGVSALVELARYFKEHQPKPNLRFIAFSGNWQGQALSRLYVANTLKRIGVEDRITCGVDLSTDSAGLAIDYNGLPGSAYGPQFKEIKPLFFGVEGTEDTGVVGEMEKYLGAGDKFYGGMIPQPHESDWELSDLAHKRPLTRAPRFYTPNESWEQARTIDLVFQTAKVWRYNHNTPLETFERSMEKFDNLKPQLEMLFYSLGRLVDFCASEENLPIVKPTIWSASQSDARGYSEVRGRVRVFSLKTAWYDNTLPRDADGKPLGKTFVFAYPYDQRFLTYKSFAFLPWPLWPARYFHQGMQSFMTCYLMKTDDDGNYYIPDIAASHPYARFNFLAYTLDKDGNIIYATDYGLHGDVEFGISDMSFFTSRMQVPITIFPCGSMVLFGLDTLEKYNFNDNAPEEWTVKVDYIQNDAAQMPYLAIEKVMRAGARTEADEYSFVQYKDVAMAFLKPDSPTEILLQAKGGTARYILNNSSQPTGEPPGYSVSYGATLPVYFTPLAMLEQIGFLNAFRLASYDKYGVRSFEAEKEHKLGSAYEKIARDAYNEADYPKAVASATLGLASEGKAYDATLGLLWDVVSTTVFYFTLLIPFSFLTERLLFPQSTPSGTIIVSTVIFVIFVGLLWIFHPGFKLADNIWITIISFLIVILTLPAVLLIVTRGLKMIKESGEKYFKSHASDAERLGVLVAALSLAISNMRRRRLRTGLTLATITLLILALVLLTTSTSFNYTYNQPREHLKTNMEGVLVSNTYNRWRAMFRGVYTELSDLYSDEAIVVPREYYNYAYSDTMASKRKIYLTRGEYSAEIPTIQIVDEREPLVTGVDKALVPGTNSRWFNSTDVFAVILSRRIAGLLHAAAGDEVTFEDVKLKVVGIFDGNVVDKEILDPDGRQLTPLYFADPSQGDLDNPGHFPGEDVIYMPRRLKERTGLLYSAIWGVVIKPFDRSRITPIADSVALMLPNIDVFKSLKDPQTGECRVMVLSAYHKVSIKGSAFMIMPLAVAFFMVLAVMLGTVHERRREINIFSSVGLSPRHVAGMFFVESVVYAGIASVLGYFMGIILLYVFRVAGLFPPVFYPNYLGIFVIYSVGLAMLATVSSSAYPMYIASRIANPSLERTWRIGTRPENGRWTIEFPFIASDLEEVLGIMAFLKEFVDHFSGEGMGVFASLAPPRLVKSSDRMLRLEFSAWLAPFERNVTQVVALVARKDEDRDRWNFAFDIQYASGPQYLWLKSNKIFIDAFRKQMLIWRAFSDKMIDDYIERGTASVNGEAAEDGK